MTHPEFLSVKNWTQFQHYKDRRPPWIKLHIELADDYEFNNLPDQTKYHIIGIWMLAARVENRIPNNDRWVADKIGAKSRFKLSTIIDLGYLIPWEEPAEDREEWASRYIAADLRATILERDNHECVVCGSKKSLEIDHIIPISKGGNGSADNLQVLCRRCNRAKRNRLTAADKALSAEQSATQMRRTETETETETQVLSEDLAVKALVQKSLNEAAA
jgi:HNH endonuclease